MNILVIGTDTVEQQLIELCKSSKLLNKIYTASENPLNGVPNVEYKDLQELVRKAKALQADIVLMCDSSLITSGMVEFLKSNLLNVLCVNKKWVTPLLPIAHFTIKQKKRA